MTGSCTLRCDSLVKLLVCKTIFLQKYRYMPHAIKLVLLRSGVLAVLPESIKARNIAAEFLFRTHDLHLYQYIE